MNYAVFGTHYVNQLVVINRQKVDIYKVIRAMKLVYTSVLYWEYYVICIIFNKYSTWTLSFIAVPGEKQHSDVMIPVKKNELLLPKNYEHGVHCQRKFFIKDSTLPFCSYKSYRIYSCTVIYKVHIYRKLRNSPYTTNKYIFAQVDKLCLCLPLGKD